jgi:hypothetical protein
MRLEVEKQAEPISDATRARIGMARPLLRATLFALAADRIERLGGYDKVTLADLAREYREGSGDCGICFEYAVHDAIERRDPLIEPRVAEVLDRFCHIRGQTRSILFGAEKGKKLELVQTEKSLLTGESLLLAGNRGKPARLTRHLENARKAFSQEKYRELLPRSIRGLWRADLFIGSPSQEYWVATTLKTNASHLEGDAGIRIGIYPEQKKNEGPALDKDRNLVLCPVPYDAGFMELFYSTFFMVKAFLSADARVPKPIDLPASADRQVAKMLEDRRNFGVLESIASLEKFAQPGLLTSSTVGDPYSSSPTSAIAPVARKV